MREKKRIAIYSFYDQEGIVDRYVEYLLTDLCRHIQRLVIVCNCSLNMSMRNKLSVYTDCILERENEGYDIWGYKAGMDMLGWEEICRYDELVLCNDSVIGPIYPFQEMFDEMESREADFWGITKHYEADGNPFARESGTKLSEHIQSYFMVFRQKLMRDGRFQEYWMRLPKLYSYEDAVGCHESIFTAKLADMGYAYDVYVNADEYRDYTPNPLLRCPDILVSEKRCPIVKRRIFIEDYRVTLHDMAGGAPARLMKQLDQNMGFDVEMIWEHILRIGRLDRIMYNLQLRYILGGSTRSKDGDISDMAVVFLDSQPEETHRELPQGMACYWMSMEQLRSPEAETIIGQHELICLLPKLAEDVETPSSSTADLLQIRYNSLICDQAYLYQIKECFRNHPRLGILYPPAPAHGNYVKQGKAMWQGGWYRREAFREMLQTDIGDLGRNHHSMYAAVVYNQIELRRLLNNQSYCLEDIVRDHNRVVEEWQRTREAHDRVVEEWRRTREAHDRVAEEWRRTQEAHDRVVEEWTRTAEALRKLQAEYDELKKQKTSRGLAGIFKRGNE